jgi:tetratricopeptide (TPR) repeat protein
MTDEEHELKLNAAKAIEEANFEEAESMYRDFLGHYEDDDNPCQLGALKVFTRLLLLKGVISEAIIYFEKALLITCNVFGTEHAETAAALVALASALRKGNGEQIEESEQIFNQALKLLRKLHGKNTPNAETATALIGLGMAIEASGNKRSKEARQAYEDALAMRRTVLGGNHPDVGDALLCIAALLGRTEEINLAATRYEQAVGVFRSAYQSEKHPRVVLCLDSLALLYRRQAKEMRKEKLFGQSTVAEMAAVRRCGGAAIVSGDFFRYTDSSFGFKKQKKAIYAALYPEREDADSSSSKGKGKNSSKDRVVLLWAYDEENLVGGWFAGNKSKDKDAVVDDNGMGAIVELNTPTADVIEEDGKKGDDSETKYKLRIMSKSSKNKSVEVFSAYASDVQVAQDWFEILGVEDEDDSEV